MPSGKRARGDHRGARQGYRNECINPKPDGGRKRRRSGPWRGRRRTWRNRCGRNRRRRHRAGGLSAEAQLVEFSHSARPDVGKLLEAEVVFRLEGHYCPPSCGPVNPIGSIWAQISAVLQERLLDFEDGRAAFRGAQSILIVETCLESLIAKKVRTVENLAASLVEMNTLQRLSAD